MINPEQSEQNEKTPDSLRENVKNKFSQAEIKGRTITNLSGNTIDPDEYRQEGHSTDYDFRIEFSQEPTSKQLTQIDEVIIGHYKNGGFKKERADADKGAKQRTVFLRSDENIVTVVRTKHGKNIEITAERKPRESEE